MKDRARVVLVFVMSIAMSMAASAEHAHTTTYSERYIPGTHGPTWGMCRTHPQNPTGSNLGAVCFERTPAVAAATMVHIVIEEDLGPAPGGPNVAPGAHVVYGGASGRVGGPWPICGAGTIPTAQGWLWLEIYVADPAIGPSACLEAGGSPAEGIGTLGIVRATFE